ncbi:MAG: DNA polymerase III subunit gamma/tau [Clostridia bacterium]|nr:DNA polymerase III subunit gamma/tau [Clostridia bacterium]
MSYLALYRKYRPTGFDGVIGQDHIVKTLINQIKTERLGHAYLFTGTRGTGKTSLAKIFAKAINCLSPINGSPCGKCESCIALADPSNIDILEIDAASNNGVNEIRELREKVQYPPVSCKYKVYIIDEVHMLSPSAFNALLKTLEEPPKHAIFILATTEAHKIPATILSRCMRFDFKLIPTEDIASHIEEIYKKQGKPYEKEAVFAIAKAGEGSLRDALSIADTAMSYVEGKLTYDQVNEILGSTNFETLQVFIDNIIDGNAGEVLETVNKLASLGKSMSVLCKDVNDLLRNLLVIKTCKNAKEILAIPETKFENLKLISDKANEERLLRAMEIFSLLENDLKYSLHPRILFETASVKASRPDSDYNIEALMSRIKSLEEKLASGVKVAVKDATKPTVAAEKESINQENELLTAQDVKGKLLFNLRKNGSEMLWNFMQTIKVEFDGKTVTLNVQTADDGELLNKPENSAKIKTALPEFADMITIKVSDREKMLDGIDQATEKIKKIFGDDIVIIND